jgi:DNA-directed RNA polymerase subunit N (RpoN/RPB10)
MSLSYDEYPILCYSCFDPIACRAAAYNERVHGGLTQEEALNSMGLMDPCCRIMMMNPSPVPFNMENRAAIEGLIPVEEAEDVTFNQLSMLNTGFKKFYSCIDLEHEEERMRDALPLVSGVIDDKLLLSQLGVTSLRVQEGLMEAEDADLEEILRQEEYEQALANEFAPMTLGTVVDEIAKFKKKEAEDMEVPTIPGIPVFNFSDMEEQTVDVGVGRQVHVLTGRTYLAR